VEWGGGYFSKEGIIESIEWVKQYEFERIYG